MCARVGTHASARACVCVCVFSFCRFTPQELLSFLHRSLIEGRRDQGRREGKVGGAGRDGLRREGGVGGLGGGNGWSLVLHSFK